MSRHVGAFAVVMGGQVRIVVRLTITDGRIAAIDTVADPAELRTLDVAVLDA